MQISNPNSDIPVANPNLDIDISGFYSTSKMPNHSPQSRWSIRFSASGVMTIAVSFGPSSIHSVSSHILATARRSGVKVTLFTNLEIKSKRNAASSSLVMFRILSARFIGAVTLLSFSAFHRCGHLPFL